MSIPNGIKIKHHKLPTTPGVYLFKNAKGKVVYVGKATNLRSRVNSYFSGRHSERSEESLHPDISRASHKQGAEISRSSRDSLEMTGGRGWRTIDEMLHEVRKIDWITTDSVIEALILEANLIKKYLPTYNVKEKDDKSFLYVVITKDVLPKVMLVRGSELLKIPNPKHQIPSKFQIQNSKHSAGLYAPLSGTPARDGQASAVLRDAKASHYMRIFGPYTSASSIRAALDLIRKWFPWSTCRPRTAANSIEQRAKSQEPKALRSTPYALRHTPCFDCHIGRCPGVCVGAVTRRDYIKNIRNVILMLEGKKAQVIKNVKLKMQNEAAQENFEEAEKLKRKLFALQHIRDVAVITAESIGLRAKSVEGLSVPYALSPKPINIPARIEGYDISNISGTSAVGSMVVFKNGEPAKNEYRKFKIKTVRGINDVAMMREVLTRRFRHSINMRSATLEGRPSDAKASHYEERELSLATPEKSRWPLPDLILVDGGWGQVNVAREVLAMYGLNIPIVGIAKGFDRKQDVPIFDKQNSELARIVADHKNLLLQVRDEAHRFAVAYHRKLRSAR